MADWTFYLLEEDKKEPLTAEERKGRKIRAEERQLYYLRSDYVPDRHRKVLRFHFNDSKGKQMIWVPGWEDLSRLFRLGALIEKRNSKKDFEFFETGAFKVLTAMPDTVEECDAEIDLLQFEEIPF